MSTDERKKRHKENLRMLIADSAVRLIAESGHENFTIRKLAESIEYSPRTIYLYFKNKDAILGEITSKAFSETLRVMKEHSDTGPEVFFPMMIDRHIRNAAGLPNLYRAIIAFTGKPEHRSSPEEEELKTILCNKLSELPDSEAAAITAELLLASLRSAAMLVIQKNESLDETGLSSYISIFTKIIMEGIS